MDKLLNYIKLLINLLNVEFIVDSWSKYGRYVGIKSYPHILIAGMKMIFRFRG